MSITVKGTIQRMGFGPGTWALVSEAGESYELYQGQPDDLHQAGLRVKVQGKIRDDVMTLAMIGPVLQVDSFEVLSE